MPKVFLSAGHGGKDPGAVAYGIKEKDINLNIMLSCKDVLEKHGVEVVCSRLKDENDSVSNEVAEANASEADVAASFLTNAGRGNGSETFYSTKDADGKRLAELCEKYVRELGQNAHGKNPVKGGDHLFFIRKTKMTAILCECAFIDNNNDNDIIDTVPEQKALGEAYAKAILEYFGIAFEDTIVELENCKPVEEPKKEVKEPVKEDAKSISPAKSFDKELSGQYEVVSKTGLHLRSGAGMNNESLLVMPNGAKCVNYGYYTNVSGIKWMYVQFVNKGTKYTGFASGKFLKKM